MENQVYKLACDQAANSWDTSNLIVDHGKPVYLPGHVGINFQ